MDNRPVDLSTALASFDALWSPHIVARVNDYDVRIAKVAGEHVWHTHDDTDEFFLVLSGELRIALRERSGEREVVLPTGSVFVVPRGTEHRPWSPAGAEILLFENGAIRPVPWDEVEHVALTRSFLANPERFLKKL